MIEKRWAVGLQSVKTEKRKWLWPQRIPQGEITLLAGIQGMGKSILLTDLISHVTTGATWPDKTECPTGHAIILVGEDTISTTVKPRYDAAGADLSKITCVLGSPSKKLGLVPFNLSKDIPRLQALVEKIENPTVIGIDPLGSYVGAIDIHRENQVRNVLYTLKMEVAEKYDIAIIAVVHLRKGGSDDPALSRILGSVAFSAIARAVWGVAHDEDDPDRRLFTPLKHNLTKRRASGYEFFIVDGVNGEGIVEWGSQVTAIAEDVMTDHGMRPEQKRERAIEIIKEALSSGPKAASIIMEKIIEEGIGERTAKSAKKILNVKSKKHGKGGWMWSLEGDPQDGWRARYLNT